jgi:hypothetical protein
MRSSRNGRWLSFAALFLFLHPVRGSSADNREAATPPALAPTAIPQNGDVIIRALMPRKDTPQRKGTIEAALAFRANRLEWIYQIDEAFVRNANAAGVEVGATMNYNAWPAVSREQDWLNTFTARDLWGKPVTRCNFRKFKDWRTSQFTADVNIPAWRDFYVTYLRELYRLPVISVMRDNQASTAGLLSDGGSFTDDSVRMFQCYLAERVPPEELQQLGIADPEMFDIRPYLIQRGAPGTDPASEQKKWLRWDGGPVMRLYAKAQRDAVVDFYREVRQRVEDDTGRRIPWSCNHTGQWGPIERGFDYALGEFYTHQLQIETLTEIARRAEQAGKLQGLQGPLDGGWEKRERAGLVRKMRRFVATAYALGLLPMVPWDMYMPGKARRFSATPDEVADLFKWVRDNEVLFDAHRTAWISCFDPVGSRQTWRWNQQTTRFPAQTVPAVRVNRECVLAVVRRSEATHVVHLVDWNQRHESLEVTLNLPTLCGSSAARIRLLRPGVPPETLSEGTACTLTIPSLTPWGMLTLVPMETPRDETAPPALVEPRTPVVAAGAHLELASDQDIWIRESAPEPGDWRRYTTGATIDRDVTIEARTAHESHTFSPTARWRFWTTAQPRPPSTPEGTWTSLFKQLSSNANVALDTFPDGSPFVLNGRKMQEACGTVGSVELTVSLPEHAAYFRIGIAAADDTEVLRPSYRVVVSADGQFLYETPIYNTVKGLVHGQEPGRRDLLLALPRGCSDLSLKLHNTGWFDQHNRIIWISPEVLAGENHMTDLHRELTMSASRKRSRAPKADPEAYKWTGGEQ